MNRHSLFVSEIDPHPEPWLTGSTNAVALLGEAPSCGLGGHECFGEEEEQVARARDGEVHGWTPAGRWCPDLAGAMHSNSAMGMPKSACDALLSQLTAGDEVSGIVEKRSGQLGVRSDEGDVTGYRRDDGGSSLHARERNTVSWSVMGGVAGWSQL